MRSGIYVDNTPPPRVGRFALWYRNHPYISDLVTAGSYLLAFGVGLAWRWTFAGPGLQIVMVIQGLITLSCLFARRSTPLTAALIGMVTPVILTEVLSVLETPLMDESWGIYVGPGVFPFDIMAPMILVFTVGSLRRTSISWATMLAAVVCAADCLWATGYSPRASAVLTLICAMGLFTAGLAGQNLRTSRLRMVELEQRNQQVLLERDHREQLAVAQERTRIAREMHDVVAHSLAVMVTIADGAAAMMDKKPDMAKQAVEKLAETGREALADTRRLVGVLRDNPAENSSNSSARPDSVSHDVLRDSSQDLVPLSPQPHDQSVPNLVQQFARTGLPITYRFVGQPLPQDAALNLTIYRIVQESLTNVLKYAPATPHIEVLVRGEVGSCEITVTNAPGEEGTIVSGSHKGLLGMRERAAVFHGTVEAGPYRQGWRVRARLYWDSEDGKINE